MHDATSPLPQYDRCRHHGRRPDRPQHRRRRQSHRHRELILEDSSGSVKLTLWREAASLDFAPDAIVAVSCAKVVRDGLWGTSSKKTLEFNPPSAPADLLEWNAVRVALNGRGGTRASRRLGVEQQPSGCCRSPCRRGAAID